MSGSATLFDAQALQNPFSAERGIGRYVTELISALRPLDFDPEVELLVNRELPVPSSLEPLITEACVRSADAVSPADGVFHVPSPFEPVRLEALWPSNLRHLPLVLTVHDVIPEIFSALYLRDPQVRQWYKRRLGFVQRADLVLVPSASTARDVERRLGVPSNRIVLTGEAPPATFVPAADHSDIIIRTVLRGRSAAAVAFDVGLCNGHGQIVVPAMLVDRAHAREVLGS